MSRPAKLLTVCLVIGIFLFSYALDVFAAREVVPGRVAARVMIRVFEEGSRKPELTVGLPAGLVEWVLTSVRSARVRGADGSETDLRKFWLRLRESNPGKPLEFADEGERVQIWLE
jgi:hypothetical protein